MNKSILKIKIPSTILKSFDKIRLNKSSSILFGLGLYFLMSKTISIKQKIKLSQYFQKNQIKSKRKILFICSIGYSTPNLVFSFFLMSKKDSKEEKMLIIFHPSKFKLI